MEPQPAPSLIATAEQGLYVYCIIESSTHQSFGRIGIGQQSDVYTVNLRDLAAVV